MTIKYLARNAMIVWFFITLFAVGFFPNYNMATYVAILAIVDAHIILELDKQGI